MQDLSVTVADYGTPMNYVMGRRRIELPCFYAEPIKEVKKRRKTKGGKYNEYTYFGTWASLVADHQVAEYWRIWFDRNLVFDRATGGNLFELDDDYELTHYVRFYYGTPDQAADERMVAYVEQQEGPNTCPAYLDVAYLFFEDVPLEKIGNRFPQASCEVSTTSEADGAGTYEWDEASDSVYWPDNDYWGPAYMPPDAYLVSPSELYGTQAGYGDTSSVVNLETLAVEYTAVWSEVTDGDFYPLAIDDEASVWGHLGGNTLYEALPGDPLNPILRATWGAEDFNLYVQGMHVFNLPSGQTLIYGCTGLGNWNCRYFVYIKELGSFTLHDVSAETGYNFWPRWSFQDDLGDVWCCGNMVVADPAPATNDQLFFYRITDVTGASPYADFTVTTGLPGANYVFYRMRGFFKNGGFVGGWSAQSSNDEIVTLFRVELDGSGDLTMVDPPAGNWRFGDATGLTDTYGGSGKLIPPNSNYFYINTGATHFAENGRTFAKIDATTLQLLTSYTLDQWAIPSDTAFGHVYLYEQNAFLGWEYNEDWETEIVEAFMRIYFVPASTGVVTLGDICARVYGMTAADLEYLDVSDLTQEVDGYSWTQGRAGDVIAPLLDIYDSDIRPNGFQQEGLRRGTRAAGPAIETEWLVRDGDAPIYTVTAIGDSDLPRRIFASFADMNAEQQPNTAVVQRNQAAVDSVREMSVDLTTLAMTAAVAQELVERNLRRQWTGSVRAEMSLTSRELGLQPGDVRPLILDGELIRGRCTRMTIKANRVIDTKWERDSAPSAAAVLAAAAGEGADDEVGRIDDILTVPIPSPGAEATGRPSAEVYDPVDSIGYVLDLPLLTDSHDTSVPFVYLVAAPAAEGPWPGADVSHSDSGTSYESGWNGFGSDESTFIGVAAAALPAALATVLDEGSEVFISGHGEELASITDEEMQINPTWNLALHGDEVYQFRDAILQSTGDYLISGLRRGARGTEWAIEGHAPAERWVLLSSVRRKDLGAGEIGDTDLYKVTTLAKNSEGTTAQELTFTAAAQRPLSPVHIELVLDGSGDWSIDFTRRTRIGGANVNGSDVPLGETSEQYKIRILDGEDVVRTIETTSSSGNLYTAAQQVTDWGGAQTTLTVEIVQMSPVLGIEGFPARASA